MQFIDELNESQRAAVAYNDGPLLVIAGAGSGKTRVLTYKIAYLLDRGMNPWNVLALTFTNKAATEMKNRIAALVGEEKAGRLNMGTFHSVFSRILRVEAQLLGYENNFTMTKVIQEVCSRHLSRRCRSTTNSTNPLPFMPASAGRKTIWCCPVTIA